MYLKVAILRIIKWQHQKVPVTCGHMKSDAGVQPHPENGAVVHLTIWCKICRNSTDNCGIRNPDHLKHARPFCGPGPGEAIADVAADLAWTCAGGERRRAPVRVRAAEAVPPGGGGRGEMRGSGRAGGRGQRRPRAWGRPGLQGAQAARAQLAARHHADRQQARSCTLPDAAPIFVGYTAPLRLHVSMCPFFMPWE